MLEPQANKRFFQVEDGPCVHTDHSDTGDDRLRVTNYWLRAPPPADLGALSIRDRDLATLRGNPQLVHVEPGRHHLAALGSWALVEVCERFRFEPRDLLRGPSTNDAHYWLGSVGLVAADLAQLARFAAFVPRSCRPHGKRIVALGSWLLRGRVPGLEAGDGNEVSYRPQDDPQMCGLAWWASDTLFLGAPVGA